MWQLTGYQRDLMIAVARLDAPSGKDVARELEGKTATNNGMLYINLNDLVDSGHLSKEQVDGRTNAYAVTDDGREALAEWFDWSDGVAR